MPSEKTEGTVAGPKLVLLESEIEKQAGLVAGRIAGRTADGFMDIAGNIVGGLMGDRVREWRTRNLVSSLSRTADFLKAKGVPLDKTKALPMGEAYAMFEEASKQDDPTVQEMWAALLANAMDADSGVRIEPAFVSTLRNIGKIEARILSFIWECGNEMRSAFPQSSISSPDEIRKFDSKYEGKNRADVYEKIVIDKYKQLVHDCQEHSMQNSISNLIQLGCISIPSPRFSQMNLTTYLSVNGEEEVEILDKDKMEDALNAISNTFNTSIDKMLPNLIPTSFLFPSVNYELTGYAQRLLRACTMSD